jgi:hypothetical protein
MFKMKILISIKSVFEMGRRKIAKANKPSKI